MKKYTINNIQDIADKIPLDKLDDFMIDFQSAIEAIKLSGGKLSEFEWTDNGKHNVKLIIDSL